MILIGLGANLPHPEFDSPAATLSAALEELTAARVNVRRQSRWYSSPAWPASDQPRYVNGVAVVETAIEPRALLALLHVVEAKFGRLRTVPNAARPIDLDLLDFDGEIVSAPDLVLPHPRLQDRAFVLLPLGEVEPEWRHPVSERSISELIAGLPAGHDVRPLDAD